MIEVEFEIRDGVAVIALRAAHRRNSLTVEMARELRAVVERLDADPAVRAAVIQGSGGHFCAGAHRDLLADIGEDPAEPARYENLGIIYDSFFRLGQIGVPLIAAVRGFAVGAGVNVLLAADVRVVGTGTRIIPGFTAIGLHPGGGHLLLAAQAMGAQGAAAMTLLGQEISGPLAARTGLAWECVDDEQVEQRAFEIACGAAKDPTLSRKITAAYRRMARVTAAEWEQAMEAERASQMWSLRRRDAAGRNAKATD